MDNNLPNSISSDVLYHHASNFLASIPDFNPCSEVTTLFFDGILNSIGVKGDQEVDELLSIDNPGLWEALDAPAINQEQDNLPGAPASDAEAINCILRLT